MIGVLILGLALGGFSTGDGQHHNLVALDIQPPGDAASDPLDPVQGGSVKALGYQPPIFSVLSIIGGNQKGRIGFWRSVDSLGPGDGRPASEGKAGEDPSFTWEKRLSPRRPRIGGSAPMLGQPLAVARDASN